MSKEQKPAMGRREFLRAVGGVSTVAVAAAATLGSNEAHAYDPGEEEAGTRYNPESDHVKAFYRTNGYESLKK